MASYSFSFSHSAFESSLETEEEKETEMRNGVKGVKEKEMASESFTVQSVNFIQSEGKREREKIENHLLNKNPTNEKYSFLREKAIKMNGFVSEGGKGKRRNLRKENEVSLHSLFLYLVFCCYLLLLLFFLPLEKSSCRRCCKSHFCVQYSLDDRHFSCSSSSPLSLSCFFKTKNDGKE